MSAQQPMDPISILLSALHGNNMNGQGGQQIQMAPNMDRPANPHTDLLQQIYAITGQHLMNHGLLQPPVQPTPITEVNGNNG